MKLLLEGLQGREGDLGTQIVQIGNGKGFAVQGVAGIVQQVGFHHGLALGYGGMAALVEDGQVGTGPVLAMNLYPGDVNPVLGEGVSDGVVGDVVRGKAQAAAQVLARDDNAGELENGRCQGNPSLG